MSVPEANDIPGDRGPLWATEPFRIFFPLGLVAAVFGLLLWPLHYAGWWEVYPAIQHPRILILGFGAAFVFGFLGTAWPRSTGTPPLRSAEIAVLAAAWLAGQSSFAAGAITWGDGFATASCLSLVIMLGIRWVTARDRASPAVLLPLLHLWFVSAVLLCWATGLASQSVRGQTLLRLLVYQGFLLIPLFGAGAIIFPGILDRSAASRGRCTMILIPVVFAILLSFAIEAWGMMRLGNGIRFAAILAWAFGPVAMPGRDRASGTRPWALRMAWAMIASGFACRIIWPQQVFAFEHFLFLGGFSQLMLLAADRFAVEYDRGQESVSTQSVRWRWIVWLMVLTAATRATADLVPATRVSHHIYAAVMLVGILVLWWAENAVRICGGKPSTGRPGSGE